ncbi:multidrug efflux transporter transcriptional repressor AcrR [Dickeya solani]|uniref:Multidrug efflux transporter transcriptional repressor AcrR n=2 Tax=Dickeya solani TaxID=1089444 RepID=A0AAP1TN88_9GAMM|nr:multidrug efflux transporter transcriptional repressor AcrR [Dickeya solani]ANE76463.1 transcriptional regulator [Dickeya solani IPO 2222]AUC44087.1 Transcription repressor of multidrug efflux pump acrAB operon, TetR (AcrR) family [Dickeya solani RNS 08.23.3.1.A]AUH08126.1 DNA-binding transcriptional repressor AcrR [Dickeya solani D s0432-1]AUH12140.1 DNA-binding transcriptional repressor AcrR [Dickeya solani]AYQ46956.1 HTH-type transcriptional regulator AcrR [Dickeya solani]
MARKTKQQAHETKLQIMGAALRLFSEHGVSSTSLSDIATAAGVTRGAIYWHFKNKAELFDEIWARSEAKISDFETEYQAKFPDDPLHVLRELLIYILRLTESDIEWRSMMEIIFHKCEFVGEMLPTFNGRRDLYLGCYEKIEASLMNCIRQGMLPLDVNPRRAAVVMRAYLSGIMENWLFMPTSFDLKNETPYLVDVLIDMLRSSPALRQTGISGDGYA